MTCHCVTPDASLRTGSVERMMSLGDRSVTIVIVPAFLTMEGRNVMRRATNRRMAAMVWGLGMTIMVGLTACGAGVPSAPSTVTVSPAEFQGSGLKPGLVLGWHTRLYQLVGTVNEKQVGKKLGQVLYHGPLGTSFVLFALRGQPTSHVIVFETTQGKFFKAIVTRR